jgi:RNase P/RNase MRP subunit POP5
MVVKSKRGRRRYIAFSTSPDVTKESLIRGFRSIAADPPYIVQCASGMAILRCSPDKREETASVMSLADPSSVPLRTSGTLRTLRDEYPILKTPKRKPN